MNKELARVFIRTDEGVEKVVLEEVQLRRDEPGPALAMCELGYGEPAAHAEECDRRANRGADGQHSESPA